MINQYIHYQFYSCLDLKFENSCHDNLNKHCMYMVSVALCNDAWKVAILPIKHEDTNQYFQ